MVAQIGECEKIIKVKINLQFQNGMSDFNEIAHSESRGVDKWAKSSLINFFKIVSDTTNLEIKQGSFISLNFCLYV